VLPVDFAKELVKYAMDFDELEAESGDTETEYGPEPEEAQAPVVTGHNQIPKPAFSNEYGNEINNGNTGKVTMNMKAEGKTKQTKNVSVMPLQLSSFGDGGQDGENSCQVNLDLVMGVELNVTVEIGRTKKLVKEILALHQGSIIELDKQAGEPVDVIINGQLIARGDVVVIDDNFGVRITEIINNNEIL
jgi:flagellar motor switch protein FliN/FliY